MIVFTIILVILAIGSFILFSAFISKCSQQLKTLQAAEKENPVSQRLLQTELADYKNSIKFYSKLRLLGTTIPILLLILILVIAGIRIVDVTEKGVIKTFGEISGTMESGLNFVNPITQTVTMYDLQVHATETEFASYTRDAQPLTSVIEYQYQLNPAYVEDVAREYGSYELLEAKLGNVVEEKVKVVFARYGAMNLHENRSTLSPEVMTEVRTIEDLFNITFTSIVVKDIDFSDAFEASVEAKMTAEQAALKAEQDKKTALIKAEQEKETALIKASQNKETAAIEAEAAIARATGEAEAMRITREALQNMPEAYIQQLYLEKWDGKLPTFMTDDSANVLLNPDIE